MKEICIYDEDVYRMLIECDPILVTPFVHLFVKEDLDFNRFIGSSDDELINFGFSESVLIHLRSACSKIAPTTSAEPSAPCLPDHSEPSAPPIKLWYQVECVICLDEKVSLSGETAHNLILSFYYRVILF